MLVPLLRAVDRVATVAQRVVGASDSQLALRLGAEVLVGGGHPGIGEHRGLERRGVLAEARLHEAGDRHAGLGAGEELRREPVRSGSVEHGFEGGCGGGRHVGSLRCGTLVHIVPLCVLEGSPPDGEGLRRGGHDQN